MKTFTFSLLLSLLATIGLAQSFVDVSASHGITMGYGSGNLGGGVSFVDFNDDGWDDLVFPSETGDSIYFFKNTNGTLAKIATPTNLPTFESKQILWGDYDNDGDQDLFITCHNGQNLLFQNDGSLIFTDVTTTAGIPTQSDPTFGAAFGDYNKDGWLDIYISNYNLSGGYYNQLLKNINGVFTDVTPGSGLGTAQDPSFAASFLDYNNDGWPDIYVAVDKTANNLLYKNDGDGTFTDVSISSGAGIVVDAMNSGVGDIDNDGDLDLYVTSTPWVPGYPGNVLLVNNGDGTFTDSSVACGVDFGEVSWAGNFFDCNNDGLLDLFVSSSQYPTNNNNMMFINNGSCSFTEADPFDEPGYSHAYGDFNQDGKLDLALDQTSGNDYKLMQNQSPSTDNWIQIELEGVVSNKDGIGAWIEVWRGGNKQVHYTTSGTGYLNQNTQTAHFGLGTSTIIDSIVVRWPSNIIDKLLPIDIPGINQKLATIVEGSYGGGLPVELVDFTARLEDKIVHLVQLQWETAAEENVKGFEIQRSTDGRHYEVIGWMDTQGNTFGGHYLFYDDQPGEQTAVYYRLKMLDLDGQFEWSPVEVVVLASIASSHLESLSPNPVSSQLALQYTSKHQVDVSIQIYNMQGLEVMTFSNTTATGQHVEVIDVSRLAEGAYILRWQTEESVQSERFIKGY